MIRALAVALVLGSASVAFGQPAAPAAPPTETPPLQEDVTVEEETESDAEAELPPAFEVNARIHTNYERELDDPTPPAGHLELARARFELTWRPVPQVEGVLGVDLSPVVSGEEAVSRLLPELLDAYVDVTPTDWFQLRAGNRKVPFSGARLISIGDLRTVKRGEYTAFLAADAAAQIDAGDSLSYSGRKVGVTLGFRVERLLRLRLDLGVSEGEEGAADPAARASIRIVKGLRLSAAVAALRLSETVTEDARWAVAYEADLLYDEKRWRVEVEAATGTNWRDPQNETFFGGYALLAYEFRFTDEDEPALEPVVRAEVVDHATDDICDHVIGLTAGATLYTLEVLRVKLNVERLERPSGCEAAGKDETTVLAQLAFDI